MGIEARFIRALHAHRHTRHRLHAEPARAHEIFQTSLLNSLLRGIYDGDLTYRQLAEHGDFGLGTFNALDGEMIAFDGKFFQIRASGEARPVKPSLKTPFALVTFFKPESRFALAAPMDYDAFGRHLDRSTPSKNFFYSVKVEGCFEFVKARSVPRQGKPYRPLAEVVESQAVFEFRNVRGTMAGFRFPDYTQGINVPGYHLHFLTEDRARGGHVLDFQMKEATIAVDHTAELHLEMPHQGDFLKAELAGGDAGTIRKIER